MELSHSLSASDVGRVDQDGEPERFHFRLVERPEARVGEVDAVDVQPDLDAAEPGVHDALALADGESAGAWSGTVAKPTK